MFIHFCPFSSATAKPFELQKWYRPFWNCVNQIGPQRAHMGPQMAHMGPKPKIVSFGPTIKCHIIFPLKISPEIQWANACTYTGPPGPHMGSQRAHMGPKPKMISFGPTIPFFHTKFNGPIPIPCRVTIRFVQSENWDVENILEISSLRSVYLLQGPNGLPAHHMC